MLNAKALLLVDHNEPQVIGVDVSGEQAVRANEHVHRAVREALEGTTLLGGGHKAAEHGHAQVKGSKPREERLKVLLRQNRGGTEHHHLLGVLAALERRAQGDLGLAKAHVAAEQAVHRAARLHVRLDVGDRGALVGREVVGEARLHLLLGGGVGSERVARHGAPARVEVNEVEGELLRRAPRLARGAAPVGGVEARETGGRAVGAHVARDAVDLLEGDKELVLARVLQEEVVPLAPRHLLADDGREERDAVRGVNDVIAGLEREGHARGVHAAGAATGLRRAGREVGDGEHGEAGGRDHDASRDRGVGEGDAAAVEGAHLRLVVLGGSPQRLRERHRLVGEAKLERLARTAVRHGKDNGAAVGHELAYAPHELGVRPGDGGLANLELSGCRAAARALDRGEREALLASKVELARGRVEAVKLGSRGVRKGEKLVCRAHALVEEGARLREDDERVGGHVLERGGGGAVELRQVALESRRRGALSNELEVGGYGGALLGALEERALGPGNRLVGEGELATRGHRHLAQLADRLPRRGDHATHAVDLVAKELQAHGACRLRGPHVDGVAVHVEGAGRASLAVIVVAHANEQRGDVLEGDLLAHGKAARREVPRALGRHAAQQGVGRGHHEAALARRQPRDSPAARPNHGVVGRGVGPGAVPALGVAGDGVLSDPRRERSGHAVGGLLAGNDDEAGPRGAGPERCHGERARGLGHDERGVGAGVERVRERGELRRGEQLSRDAVDEHGRPSHDGAPASAGEVGAGREFFSPHCSGPAKGAAVVSFADAPKLALVPARAVEALQKLGMSLPKRTFCSQIAPCPRFGRTQNWDVPRF